MADDTPIIGYNNAPAHSRLRGFLARTTPLKSKVEERPSSHDLLRYWNSARGALEVPRRNDIDPRAIGPLLPYTFILEEIAPGVSRFRVAGSHLADLLGMDVRGMPLSACILPGGRGDLADAMERVFSESAVFRAMITSPGQMRRPELHGELLVLPLRDEMGDVTRAIGCLITRGQIGQTPRRFELSDARVDPVKHDRTPASIRSRPTPQPVEPVPSLKKAEKGRPSYLRLVVSN